MKFWSGNTGLSFIKQVSSIRPLSYHLALKHRIILVTFSLVELGIIRNSHTK